MRRLAIFILTALLLCPDGLAQKLKAYLPPPEKANGAAVIVCPGGSYYWLSRKVEGADVAERLAESGFAAFVLFYRHSGTRYFLFREMAFPQNHYPDALDDLRRAVVKIKREASEYSVDSSKVGVMGFSAGGHLVLNCGEEVSEESGISSRPSFVASIYPVVTMSDESIVHRRSRTALLGRRKGDPELRRRLSMELDIPDGMPPVFLVNCADDPIVDYRNSEVMDKALSESGIPHRYVQFPSGGHGFGTSSAAADWFGLFLDWFSELGL